MKILHVIDSGGLYGAEVMLLSLMEEQVALGLTPLLASIGEHGIDEKPLEREARARGLRVRAFRMKPGPNLCGVASMLAFAREEGVELIHSHGYKGNILFGLLPRWVRRLPLVTTVHGWTCTGGVSRMMVYEWLDAVSLGRIDRVVLVNQAMTEHPRLRDRRGISLATVPNGIAPAVKGSALDPAIEAFCRQGDTIGAVGRLSEEKGFHLLVDAFAILVGEGRDLRLVILGEGGRRGELEEKVRALRLEHRVLLPGYLPDARRYLPLFRIFAMPSLTEGLPMVLLEAMQAGVPVVATRVGGIPDVLQGGSSGLLVEPGLPRELARGIGAALDHPEERAQRVQRGKERVADAYSSRAMAERYREIYHDVLQ